MRGAVLQGAGQHFSVGGNPYRSVDFISVPLPTLARTCRELYSGFLRLRRLDAAVTCAVHGALIGGGVAACLNTDYVVAEASTTFLHGNLSRGVCPLGLLSQTFIQTLGRSRALEIYLQDAKLDSAAAAEIGLVDELRVKPDVTKARAHLIASCAARLEGVARVLRATRERIDLSVQASEAFGHAMCQKENSGLSQSPLRDHFSAPLPSAAVAELLVECRPPLPPGQVRVDRIWLTEVIKGPEMPTDADVVYVYRGKSTNFCLGGDPSPRKLADGSFLNRLVDFEKLIKQIDAHPLPIVSLCHGATRGGGMLFACVASAVLAHSEATFGFPEIHRGVLPGLVSVVTQRRLDLATCERLMCMRDAIGAKEGVRVALVDFVGAAEEMEGESLRITGRFRAMGMPLLRHYAHTTRRDHESRCTPTTAVNHGIVPRRSTLPLGFDTASGIAVLDFGDDATGDGLAELTRAIADTPSLYNSLRVIVLNVDGSKRQHADTLMRSARRAARLETTWKQLCNLHVPIVCTARGTLTGSGLSAFLLADYRIATEQTTFRFGVDTHWRLGHLLKSEDLVALRIENGAVPATRARPLGLVAELCNDSKDTVEKRAVRFASWLSHHPALGQRRMLSLSRYRSSCTGEHSHARHGTARGLKVSCNGCDAGGAAKHSVLQSDGSSQETSLLVQCLIAGSDRERSGHLSTADTSRLSRPQMQGRRSATFELLRHTALGAPPLSRRETIDRMCVQRPMRLPTGRRHAGIHAIEVYMPADCTPAEQLHAACGVSGPFSRGRAAGSGSLMEMYGACGEDEDATSMALTVMGRVVHTHMVPRAQIGLVHVGCSESRDRSKSVKSELMARFEAHDMVDVEGLVSAQPRSCFSCLPSLTPTSTHLSCVHTPLLLSSSHADLPTLLRTCTFRLQDLGNSSNSGISCLHACVDWSNSAAWDGRWAVAICVDAASVPVLDLSRPNAMTLSGAIGMLIGPGAPVCIEPARAYIDSHRWTVSRPVGGTQTTTSIITSPLGRERQALEEVLCRQHGFSGTMDEHCHSLYCMQGGPEVAHHTFMESYAAGASALPPALLESIFEQRVASSLRLSASLGTLITAGLLPICSLLMHKHASSPRLASVYACADGTTASSFRLSASGSTDLCSALSVQAALARRRVHGPAAFRALCARRDWVHRSNQPVGGTNGWSRGDDRARPGGSYYIRQVTSIGQREYASLDLTLVQYATPSPVLRLSTRSSPDAYALTAALLPTSRDTPSPLPIEETSGSTTPPLIHGGGDRLSSTRQSSSNAPASPLLANAEGAPVSSKTARRWTSRRLAERNPDLAENSNTRSMSPLACDTPSRLRDESDRRTLSRSGGKFDKFDRRNSQPGAKLAHHVAKASKVAGALARELLRGQFSKDMPLMEAGLDSFGMMEFQSQLSERLGGLKLPATLIFDYPTLREVESYVGSRAAEAGGATDMEQTEEAGASKSSPLHGFTRTARQTAGKRNSLPAPSSLLLIPP